MAVEGKSSGAGAKSGGAARPGAEAPRARSRKAREPGALNAPVRPSAEAAAARHLEDVEGAGRIAERGAEGKAARAKPRTEAKREAPAEGAAASAPERAAKPRRYGLVAAFAGLAVVVLAVAAYGGWLLWRPDVAGGVAERPGPVAAAATGELAARINALEQAVTELERKTAQVEERTGAAVARAAAESAAAGSAAGRNTAAIDELSGRVSALEQGGPSQAVFDADALAAAQAETRRLAEAVAELGGRLTALEQSLRAAGRAPAGLASASRQEARMLALMALRDALRSAGPFAVEMAALERAFEGDEAVAAALVPLAEWAGRGVPTLETLQRRFEELAPRLLRAATAPADGGWLAEIWSGITSLVVIRRIGEEAPGDAPGAVLARAEAKIARGELGPAVAELAKLRGPAAEKAGEWLNAARGRLAAEAALKALSARATALPEGTEGGGSGAARPGGGPAGAAPAQRRPDPTMR